jgi:hypothetical protein
MADFLSDKEWRDLLDDIDAGNVIPVIGTALITLNRPDSDPQPLYSALASLLATELGLPEPEKFATTAQVAAAYALAGNGCSRVFTELRALLRTVEPGKSEATVSPILQYLACIPGFSLFVGTTPDHHMAEALRLHRPEFDACRHVIVFHPNESPEERDLPSSRIRNPQTILYQLLGDQETRQCRDFVVWEEDLMEYIYGLIKHSDQLKNLFSAFKSHSLLFLGAPADDWMVRFLLRVVRGERLSSRKNGQISEYIADEPTDFNHSSLLFFDRAVQTTRLISGNPTEFVNELFQRWQQNYGDDLAKQFLNSLPDEMPRDAVFISYAKEDFPFAVNIARALHEAGVPIWIDRRNLQAGQHYHEKLEEWIRLRCSLFVAVVSPASEANNNRYVHNERRWAAERQGNLKAEFYIPCLYRLSSPDTVRFEPDNVRNHRHFHSLTHANLKEFARLVHGLYVQWSGA